MNKLDQHETSLMTRVLMIWVPVEPTGKGRPRFTRKGVAYTPEKTRKAEELISFTAKGAMAGREPPRGPVAVDIAATFEIPTSWSKARKAAPGMPTKKPDIDNIAKLVLDALNGVAFHDDAQVVSLTARKDYAQLPCLCVTVWEVRS